MMGWLTSFKSVLCWLVKGRANWALSPCRCCHVNVGVLLAAGVLHSVWCCQFCGLQQNKAMAR